MAFQAVPMRDAHEGANATADDIPGVACSKAKDLGSRELDGAVKELCCFPELCIRKRYKSVFELSR